MGCEFKGCRNLSLSLSKFCWDHLEDKEDYKVKIIKAVGRQDDLTGYNLEKIVLREAHLEKALLTKANLSQADLSGSYLFDSRLDGADLIGAKLSNCDLTHCNLKNADLTKANIAHSRLWNADLTGSNLTECDVSGADLWNASLFEAKLWRTNIAETNSLTRKSFSKDNKILEDARIDEAGLSSAEDAYRDLKKYFISKGMYNDASWASFKEKTMERFLLKKNLNPHYIPSLVMNLLCGYGEKPSRIVASAISTVLFFALIYFLFKMIENSNDPNYALRWSDYIYYSTVTFTTVGYGDFIPKSFGPYRLMAALEAFMGVFLTGLFIFTLARKYSGR